MYNENNLKILMLDNCEKLAFKKGNVMCAIIFYKFYKTPKRLTFFFFSPMINVLKLFSLHVHNLLLLNNFLCMDSSKSMLPLLCLNF